ncbi:dihydrofolate reductase family protein [Paenibacillus sp. CC-CFT747]|nr:dihydrofolate reductase family protein [Paenibacillus sp. CC-CFT747]
MELTNMDKVVFSRRMKESTWSNTRFYDGNSAEIVRQTKQSASSDILILGSGSIVQQLVQEELIDEFILIVTPVVAGEGKPLFPHGKPINLSLVQTRAFDSGNLIVHYVLK